MSKEHGQTTIDRYDYIVIGAGSAGSVLASRLTEDANNKVLLLEAGGETHPLSRVPISYGLFINKPGVNWLYSAAAEDNMNGRAIPIPRGRMLGGSSAINGLVFVRGQPLDFDTWAQLGNRGWSYQDVLPVFKRMETYEGGENEWRGGSGPLRVSESPDDLPLYDSLKAGAAELGLPYNPDYNSPDQEGIVKTQRTISNGRRMSVSLCYLEAARKRRNLRIRTNAMTQRVLLEGKRCIGVEFIIGDRLLSAHARKEVIMCTGAINTPQLLELSGIGQPEVLRANGIDVKHELQGVGENLRDHLAPRMVSRIKHKGTTYNDQMQGLGKIKQGLRYLFERRGFASIPSAPMLAFIRSREGLEAPDVQFHFVPFAIENIRTRSLMREPGMTTSFYACRPESTGSIHIKSANPNEHPAIKLNFLSAELDKRILIDSFRWNRRLHQTSAMLKIVDAELKPGGDVESDDEIVAWIRANAETAYHPTCTCKMGTDPMAVVDPQLRVHGLQGLRIADGSIMPTLVSGNTNAACIMIGEKASDLILNRASPA
jgi:choline dehydrogenase